MRAIGSVSPLLLVGPSWVGDMVMAASLIEVLRLREPGRPIDVIAPPAALPIARLMAGVRRAIPLGVVHGELNLLGRWRIGRALRSEGYTKAIILPRAFKAALLPFAAGIPERVGYKGEWRTPLLTDARADPNRKTARTIDRFVALALPEGTTPAPPPRPRLMLPDGARDMVASKFPLPGEGPVLILCPGAEFGPSKRWPAQSYGVLARRAIGAGWRVRLLGSARDAEEAEVVVRETGGVADNLAGRTTLIEAAAILADADVVVTNDSGLMHVASAFDRRIVALYGSSSEKMTPPTSPFAQIIAHDLPCRPCMKRECPLGTLACLKDITPEEVFEAVERIAR